jgi:hypothetical protein
MHFKIESQSMRLFLDRTLPPKDRHVVLRAGIYLGFRKCVPETLLPRLEYRRRVPVVPGGEEEIETRHAQKFRIFCLVIFQIEHFSSFHFLIFLWQDAASVLHPGSSAY